ncbi:MAG: 4Fe-4S dicluster domain-containing protein [Epsilonproteobacteria bacterium]|nr:4Fe-4S dicluster domain-containing protein [Campylobacterota bacterium]
MKNTDTRREFLKTALKSMVVSSMTIGSIFTFLSPEEARAAVKNVRWGFLVDTNKCVGCGLCVKACKLENDVPYSDPITRTWVERYVVLNNGRLLIDSPNGGRDGYTSEVTTTRLVQESNLSAVATKFTTSTAITNKITPDEIANAFFVPKLCNQCDKPPCVQVCPVGATYQMENGIVLVDRSWCIGCGYCIQACPYGARFFNPVLHTAEKCTFCYHRLVKKMQPACVEACPFGARKIGNLMDPSDPVRKIILSEKVGVLKPAYGTKPQAFYIGLGKNVR